MQQAKASATEIGNRRTPLRALRSFCAAARHQSFKLAAEELFVTASAVSHQVKGLEEELGAIVGTVYLFAPIPQDLGWTG